MGKLREQMPIVDAFIDSLRQLFGREQIDIAIVQGIADGTFHARENGHEVGRPLPEVPGYPLTLAKMVPWSDVPRGTRGRE
jgi:hypothetical protein